MKLTRREIEVCLLVMEGYANKDISNSMNISLGTVKINMNRIFEKLNLDDRLHLNVLLHQLIK